MKYAYFSFRFFLVVFLAIFFHGCIGIGALGIGDRSSPTGNVLNFPGRNILVHNQGQRLSADYVWSQWGEPTNRKQIDDGGDEIWEYQGQNLRWHGVVPMILLPLPLVVPFGHDYVSFVIQNGQVQSTTTTRWAITFGFYCGYAMFYSEMKGKVIVCEKGLK